MNDHEYYALHPLATPDTWTITKLEGEQPMYRLYAADDFHGITLKFYPTLEEIDRIFAKFGSNG